MRSIPFSFENRYPILKQVNLPCSASAFGVVCCYWNSMGFISRRVIPACGNMCICCPALRPSSRQPVKRYKKLLREIFPKSHDGCANERKIIKLCEYAARNPLRIPKIAKFLEQKTYKELRVEHFNYIGIIMEVYSKLLCICKEQMACFATSILNVIEELLNSERQDTLRSTGCRTLTMFIYSQVDGTYAHNVETLVSKTCLLARTNGDDSSRRCLRAESLECLASMVWFMSTFSHIFTAFDEIVHVVLDNYGSGNGYCDGNDDGGEAPHNWVEAVRSNAGVMSGMCNEPHVRKFFIRRQPEFKDSSAMTREERENPKLWARICIKRIIEMTKEVSTMRRILDSMLLYFDTNKLWDPQQGLALIVLLDVIHFLRDSGMEQIVLGHTIRHLDHKNVVHDLQMKSAIIHTGIGLIRELGPQKAILKVGVVKDLCRHLRKSFQASLEMVDLHDANWNASLRSSIKDCLLEISRGINNAKPLFDILTVTLEGLPTAGADAKATISSMLILACMISTFTDLSSMVLPESLLLQILKSMMHPDPDVRVGVHRIFSVLLVRCENLQRHEVYFHPEYICEQKRLEPRATTAFASAAALLEKLRREKFCGSIEKLPNDINCSDQEKNAIDGNWKHGRMHATSNSFYKIGRSFIERNSCPTNSAEMEPQITALNDDQIAQLLSAFWIQANMPDNIPSNYEAIAQSFCLTLLSACLKNSNHENAVRLLQLPLTIKNVCLASDVISPCCRRSMFILSMVMLNSGGKCYNIPELCHIVRSVLLKIVDPFLSTVDGFQLYVTSKQDCKEYGSDAAQEEAFSYVENLKNEFKDFDLQVVPIIACNLSAFTGLEEDDLVLQLSETYAPEDGLLFGPNSLLDWFHNPEVAHSDEGFSVDEECSTTHSIEDDIASKSPAPAELLHSFSINSTLPVSSQVIGVGQLLESALQVAGQVVGTAVSTSPLPYGTLTGHCETLGMGTRRKLSSWLSSHDLMADKMVSLSLANDKGELLKEKICKENEQSFTTESWLSLRLPPASPFDNFLKAARY